MHAPVENARTETAGQPNPSLAEPLRSTLPPPLTFRSSTARVASLDILRGLAIVLMILSGMLPMTLPNWADHGYQPHYKFDEASGTWYSALKDGQAVFDATWKAFTWVDWVFPMFLFAMGAAIPIALSRLRERGAQTGEIVRGIFGRWLVLIAFAVIVRNIAPPITSTTTMDSHRMLTLASFGAVFLFFVRWPAGTPRVVVTAIRWIAGTVIAIRITGYAVRRADLGVTDPSQFFHWGRADTIVNVLAQTYLIAALAWLMTRRWPTLRLALLLPLMLLAHVCQPQFQAHAEWLWMGRPTDWPWSRVLFTLRDQPWTTADLVQVPKHVLDLPSWVMPLNEMAQTRPWVKPAFDLSPMWDFTWYKYLFAVVPGTLVGDWLHRWSRRSSVEVIREDKPPTDHRWLPLALAVLTCVTVFVGLRNYGLPTLGLGGPLRTPMLALVLALPAVVTMGFIVLPSAHGELWIERRLFKVGAGALVFGLVLACVPIVRTAAGWRVLEGGISKGPPATLSFYATSVGLCCVLMVGLLRAFDVHKSSRPRLGPMAATGQNPLLAYYLAHGVFGAVFGLGLFNLIGQPFGEGVHSLDDLLHSVIARNMWLDALTDVIKTALIVGVVWLLTRVRIFWRA